MIPDPAINRGPMSTAMDILNTQLPPDTIALWWLGQAGFVLCSSSSIFYLDPFLSSHPARLIPPLFTAGEGPPADLAAAAGVKLLVPTHYEMFSANQGRPGVLVDYVRAYHPTLTCYIPAHGRRFTYKKGDLH
jgi:L-ascorbate metabolism protein UlaG (beta-lactamase superfamily)